MPNGLTINLKTGFIPDIAEDAGHPPLIIEKSPPDMKMPLFYDGTTSLFSR
jgi:hypothetical protein